MEDTGRTSIWVWVLGVIALLVAIVGLVIALSANNNTVSTDQVVNEATAQLKGELSGLGGALKAGKAAQVRANHQAAHDRARIKREVALAVAGARKQIGKLNSEVKQLQTQGAASQQDIANLTTKVTSLSTSVSHLSSGQKTLEEEMQTLRRRLNQVGA
jgi:chromosome segregation ATPase